MPIIPLQATPSEKGENATTQTAHPKPPLRGRRGLAPPPDERTHVEPQKYEVGYGRPPVHTRFKPGYSGNPKGRPKDAKGLNTLARELLTAKVPVRTASGEKKMRRIEAVLHKTFELALKGNPRAQSQMLSLYASSVPEAAHNPSEAPAEDLTMTDVAILDELREILGGKGDV